MRLLDCYNFHDFRAEKTILVSIERIVCRMKCEGEKEMENRDLNDGF